ncbi:hypothetical protein [Garciella nitratireducens]|uniref:hypothetical protein n=1 Tax=Garciella nitratireducens TaxID=218205 RepID=UPI001BD4F7F4|nr:hypothetical protein [Garciella nitratireducens]
MKIPILVYIILFLGSFLIGSFGVAPMLEIDSTFAKTPYILFVLIGYVVLIVFFILWYRGKLEEIIYQYLKKKPRDPVEKMDIEELPEQEQQYSEIQLSMNFDEIGYMQEEVYEKAAAAEEEEEEEESI